MRAVPFFIFFILLCIENIQAQNTEIQWQNVLHSQSGDDRITSVCMLPDSNFIIAGEDNTSCRSINATAAVSLLVKSGVQLTVTGKH